MKGSGLLLVGLGGAALYLLTRPATSGGGSGGSGGSGGPLPSDTPCPLDANIDAATAAHVRDVLSSPDQLTDDAYDELSLSLVMAGYSAAAVCVNARKLAGHPIP